MSPDLVIRDLALVGVPLVRTGNACCCAAEEPRVDQQSTENGDDNLGRKERLDRIREWYEWVYRLQQAPVALLWLWSGGRGDDRCFLQCRSLGSFLRLSVATWCLGSGAGLGSHCGAQCSCEGG